MEAWQTILLAFGGNAALIAILAALAKSLLEKLIVRDTKTFEAELKAKTDSEIERLKAEMTKSLESYKIQLKKSEVFFLRELDAASAFASLIHSILPGYSNPSTDWYEACESMARDFGRIETKLDEFMAKHGAVLTEEERIILIDATADAGYGKFEVIDGEVDTDTNKKADEMFRKLKSLEEMLLARVRSQASL